MLMFLQRAGVVLFLADLLLCILAFLFKLSFGFGTYTSKQCRHCFSNPFLALLHLICIYQHLVQLHIFAENVSVMHNSVAPTHTLLFVSSVDLINLLMMPLYVAEVCYLSEAPGHYAERHRCATERVEGVTGLDILYDDFHNRSMESMQASDFRKSCGLTYTCPDGIEECQTRSVL